MSKVTMYKCDLCDVLAEALNEGIVRLLDRPVEIRYSICDDCTSTHFGDLEERPRRGRRPEEQAA